MPWEVIKTINNTKDGNNQKRVSPGLTPGIDKETGQFMLGFPPRKIQVAVTETLDGKKISERRRGSWF